MKDLRHFLDTVRARAPEQFVRVERPVDAVWRIPEHVDRARAQVRRADALGEHDHALAALGQPHGRNQPGEPGADDDDHGRCSTSSSPWKIQSSSRAWRS